MLPNGAHLKPQRSLNALMRLLHFKDEILGWGFETTSKMRREICLKKS
jgi:hypothetical protein